MTVTGVPPVVGLANKEGGGEGYGYAFLLIVCFVLLLDKK